MNYELIILRYGELALKGKETRKRFENVLISNIKNAFRKEKISSKIIKEWGRIYVYTIKINKCIDILQKIFGITSISPAYQTKSDMESMSKLAVDISKEELIKEKSFALRVNRTGKHVFTSMDVAVKIGNEIVKNTKASVNLSNPDFELFIEIRNDKAFLFTKKIHCVGGMPFGTQGNIIALIDKLDSILAAWYLIHRGCKVIFVITKEFNKDVLNSFIENWFLKSSIFAINPKNNIYEQINQIAYKRYCDAVVTNHTVFNNSKIVLSEIRQLKKYLITPVLHPLIAMNEKEIINKCKEIGLKI